MSPERVRITDEGINRDPSSNGYGMLPQQRSRSVTGLKDNVVTEMEVVEIGDDRDIRKKQVRTSQPISTNTLYLPRLGISWPLPFLVYNPNVNISRDSNSNRSSEYRLAYQSIGVIYGDIGTSPLYVYSSTFSSEPSHDDLLGALSIIIWSLTLMVSIKYVLIVLRADDEGEGGTFAVYSLLSRHV